ncbi:hypothetical protein F5878DRAFT_613040, partial [Lentinula raphanica]
MLFKVAISTTVLVTALLHTFVGTVAAIPSEPLIIYCKGPGDVTSVLAVTFVATTQVLGPVKMVNLIVLS